MEHRHSLFAYIFSIVPNRADAEDILQDVSTIIWEKFDDFEKGSNFAAWAKRIAFFEIKASRTRFARSKVVFDETVFEAVAATAAEMADEISDGREALDGCLAELPTRDRDMLMTRYAPGRGVAEAAAESGRSMQATYKALARLRSMLLHCVTDKLSNSAEAYPGGANS